MLATAFTIRRRSTVLLTVVAVTAGLLLATPGDPAGATPINATDATYGVCDRVFPDPHAYWPAPAAPAGQSPFAKGNGVPPSCKSVDFLSYSDMINGLTYLETQYPEFVEFINLEEDFGGNDDCATSTSNDDYCSAGLPQAGAARERQDLFLVRITDERSATDSPGNLPLQDKKFFAFPLSIHGIERAGVEGGTRAAEDLPTWAYCEAVANGETVPTAPSALPEAPNCAIEGIPHPLLEAQSDTPVPGENISAGQALKQSAIYFIYANPDGWRRGDPDNLARFYQRYNGNGVDMNRDWPNIGFTFKPYTPWSEPETKGFGEVLQDIRPQWDGGIDLHGQLIDRAFSFTLLGALPNGDYGQNQRILQTTQGAWEDAEERLGWHNLIVPNDEPRPSEAHMYGVQWGTVWDTIDYTVTGAFGDWIASPIGLGADGIDNEMSLSHLSNCGIGSCYLTDFEQLHIDGNKSLVYAMINYTLLPEDDTFAVPGTVGYVTDPTRIADDGTGGSPVPGQGQGLPTQADSLNQTLLPPDFVHEFTVEGPNSATPVYNGGLVGTATPNFSIGGVGGTSLVSLVLEKYRSPEEDPDQENDDNGCGEADDRWEEVNRYFNQSSLYLQTGEAVHTNNPTPGLWRICVTGNVITQIGASAGFDLDIDFTGEEAFELPPGGQAAYDVSNMDFFEDLAGNMAAGQLVGVSPDSILNGTTNLDQFTSLVITDDAFPGYTESISGAPAQANPAPVSNPGAGTAACAYGTTGELPPTCFTAHEFNVDAGPNNQQLIVTLTTIDPASDWDLYLQRQSLVSGEWFDVAQSASGGGNETITLFTPPSGHYRALVVNYSASSAGADQLTVEFNNTYAGPPIPASTRSDAELASWGAKLLAFVQNGGNLVLTDGAVKDLAYMGVFERRFINTFSAYAGFIGFTRDGTSATYTDPLALDVNAPGAAEGPQHRHQTYEPVPIGFAIQDEAGADYNSAPVWGVDQTAWEAAGGRTVGVTTADQVTLGELKVGNGTVRVIGALLPMPTEQYYHPFGLASYALTYTGYQVLKNTLQWTRPTATGGVFIPKDCSRLKKLTGYNIVIGTQGKDTMVGTSGKDGLCGRKGKDKIRGLGDNDVLIGGKHADKIVGAAGNDGLFAGAGNDRLSGGAGKDRLVGHKGNDRLAGGGGRDVHRSGKGKDACRGGPGNDKYQGCEKQA